MTTEVLNNTTMMKQILIIFLYPGLSKEEIYAHYSNKFKLRHKVDLHNIRNKLLSLMSEKELELKEICFLVDYLNFLLRYSSVKSYKGFSEIIEFQKKCKDFYLFISNMAKDNNFETLILGTDFKNIEEFNDTLNEINKRKLSILRKFVKLTEKEMTEGRLRYSNNFNEGMNYLIKKGLIIESEKTVENFSEENRDIKLKGKRSNQKVPCYKISTSIITNIFYEYIIKSVLIRIDSKKTFKNYLKDKEMMYPFREEDDTIDATLSILNSDSERRQISENKILEDLFERLKTKYYHRNLKNYSLESLFENMIGLLQNLFLLTKTDNKLRNIFSLNSELGYQYQRDKSFRELKTLVDLGRRVDEDYYNLISFNYLTKISNKIIGGLE